MEGKAELREEVVNQVATASIENRDMHTTLELHKSVFLLLLTLLPSPLQL
jgi:hypothetical protein